MEQGNNSRINYETGFPSNWKPKIEDIYTLLCDDVRGCIVADSTTIDESSVSWGVYSRVETTIDRSSVFFDVSYQREHGVIAIYIDVGLIGERKFRLGYSLSEESFLYEPGRCISGNIENGIRDHIASICAERGCSYRKYEELVRRFSYGQYLGLSDSLVADSIRFDRNHSLLDWVGFDIKKERKTNKKAEKLLLSYLSKSQKKQYKQDKTFVAIGSSTKTKYQINPWEQINVYALDSSGVNVTGKMCVVFSDSIPIEDHMLAQKLLIETNEEEFLDKAIKWAI